MYCHHLVTPSKCYNYLHASNQSFVNALKQEKIIFKRTYGNCSVVFNNLIKYSVLQHLWWFFAYNTETNHN